MSSVLVKQQHQISGVQNELIYQGWERFMNPRTPTPVSYTHLTLPTKA